MTRTRMPLTVMCVIAHCVLIIVNLHLNTFLLFLLKGSITQAYVYIIIYHYLAKFYRIMCVVILSLILIKKA